MIRALYLSLLMSSLFAFRKYWAISHHPPLRHILHFAVIGLRESPPRPCLTFCGCYKARLVRSVLRRGNAPPRAPEAWNPLRAPIAPTLPATQASSALGGSGLCCGCCFGFVCVGLSPTAHPASCGAPAHLPRIGRRSAAFGALGKVRAHAPPDGGFATLSSPDSASAETRESCTTPFLSIVHGHHPIFAAFSRVSGCHAWLTDGAPLTDLGRRAPFAQHRFQDRHVSAVCL